MVEHLADNFRYGIDGDLRKVVLDHAEHPVEGHKGARDTRDHCVAKVVCYFQLLLVWSHVAVMLL